MKYHLFCLLFIIISNSEAMENLPKGYAKATPKKQISWVEWTPQRIAQNLIATSNLEVLSDFEKRIACKPEKRKLVGQELQSGLTNFSSSSALTIQQSLFIYALADLKKEETEATRKRELAAVVDKLKSEFSKLTPENQYKIHNMYYDQLPSEIQMLSKVCFGSRRIQ
jgi:hypothetical protein